MSEDYEAVNTVMGSVAADQQPPPGWDPWDELVPARGCGQRHAGECTAEHPYGETR